MRAQRRIPALRCARGCLWLHDHDACPECGGRLTPVSVRNDAIVVSHTVARVTPSGVPVRLGVARTIGGATTLCLIEGGLRGTGRDRVRLVRVGGRFHAIPLVGARVERHALSRR